MADLLGDLCPLQWGVGGGGGGERCYSLRWSYLHRAQSGGCEKRWRSFPRHLPPPSKRFLRWYRRLTPSEPPGFWQMAAGQRLGETGGRGEAERRSLSASVSRILFWASFSSRVPFVCCDDASDQSPGGFWRLTCRVYIRVPCSSLSPLFKTLLTDFLPPALNVSHLLLFFFFPPFGVLV